MKNLGDQLQVLNLYAVATVTADGLSSAIDLQQLDGEIAVLLDSGAGGVGATLACKLVESDTSGGSYTDVASGGFSLIGNAASVQKLSLNKDEMKQFVKLSLDVSGTASFPVSAKIVGINKYPA
jgi:hypothetical protein